MWIPVKHFLSLLAEDSAHQIKGSLVIVFRSSMFYCTPSPVPSLPAYEPIFHLLVIPSLVQGADIILKFIATLCTARQRERLSCMRQKPDGRGWLHETKAGQLRRVFLHLSKT